MPQLFKYSIYSILYLFRLKIFQESLKSEKVEENAKERPTSIRAKPQDEKDLIDNHQFASREKNDENWNLNYYDSGYDNAITNTYNTNPFAQNNLYLHGQDRNPPRSYFGVGNVNSNNIYYSGSNRKTESRNRNNIGHDNVDKTKFDEQLAMELQVSFLNSNNSKTFLTLFRERKKKKEKKRDKKENKEKEKGEEENKKELTSEWPDLCLKLNSKVRLQ